MVNSHISAPRLTVLPCSGYKGRLYAAPAVGGDVRVRLGSSRSVNLPDVSDRAIDVTRRVWIVIDGIAGQWSGRIRIRAVLLTKRYSACPVEDCNNRLSLICWMRRNYAVGHTLHNPAVQCENVYDSIRAVGVPYLHEHNVVPAATSTTHPPV